MFLFSRKKQEKVPPTVQTIFIPPAGGEEQGMSFALANLQGIGNRQQQEDAFAFGNALDEKAIAQRGLLAVVADGMGGMEGTCGALCGAEMILGLKKFQGKSVNALSKQIHQEFTQKCGASLCKDLKGVTTGKMLCSCDDCVRNAVEIAEKYIFS